MKAPEFYSVLQDYINVLSDHGFKKKSKNLFVDADDIHLTIVLDKWRWNDEVGWAFLVRLTDMKGVDPKKYERPRRIFDIRPMYLVADGGISEDSLKNLYSPYKITHPKLYERVNTVWFGFYDEENLRHVLATLLPLIARNAKQQSAKWVSRRA